MPNSSTITKTKEYIFKLSDDIPEFGSAWYVVNTASGHEYKVIEALKTRMKSLGVEHKIYQAVIPLQKKMIIRRGQKVEAQEKVLPGYILLQMLLEDDAWSAVRLTPGVTGFIGVNKQPTRISQDEVDRIVNASQEEKPRFQTSYSAGEVVKIIDGPFSDFIGTIDNIDETKGKVRVLVSFFERETPVELDFLQISKEV